MLIPRNGIDNPANLARIPPLGLFTSAARTKDTSGADAQPTLE
ncbi:Uncharacterised protein [Mycobacteroides abscessus subsp. abscessus]|nr:Uncharacterised protein [Mycobacteroides abscessus subsp. abscessus]